MMIRGETTGADQRTGRTLWGWGQPKSETNMRPSDQNFILIQTKQMHIMPTWNSIRHQTISNRSNNYKNTLCKTYNFWRFQSDHPDPFPQVEENKKYLLHSHHLLLSTLYLDLDGLQGQPSWASDDSCYGCYLSRQFKKTSPSWEKCDPYTYSNNQNVFLEMKLKIMTLHEKKVLLQATYSYSTLTVGETHLNIVEVKCAGAMAMTRGWGHMSHLPNCGPPVFGSQVIKTRTNEWSERLWIWQGVGCTHCGPGVFGTKVINMMTEDWYEMWKWSVTSMELRWPLQCLKHGYKLI